VAEITDIVKAFADSALRAKKIGFDLIEIQACHGYLLHEFLASATNKRTDAYGGTLENRVRFVKEILLAVRNATKDMPITIRMSGYDWVEGGISEVEAVEIVNMLKDLLDGVHVSTGGLVNDAVITVVPKYQVKYAANIKKNAQVVTIATGSISTLNEVEEILESKEADFVALGRALLKNPMWTLNNMPESTRKELIAELKIAPYGAAY
jgi:NADPH2 dehydrogenase